MKVLIVEDEELSAERLQNLIIATDNSIEIMAIIPSVFETITYLHNTENIIPDLIFLDIHLEDDNGFKIVENMDLMIPVIFTTAYDKYLQKAFTAHSIDYLLKPINQLHLQTAISKFKKLSAASKKTIFTGLERVLDETMLPQKYKDRFLCSAGSRVFTFKISEIAYFTIQERATFLRLLDGRHFAVEYSLEKLSQLLDPTEFFRVNRTLLISINAIREMQVIAAGKLKIELKPAISYDAYVSAERVTEFKNWLGR